MRFIGDVHGKFDKYLKLLDCDESIQIGDMGIGFGRDLGRDLPELSLNHRFIRGNHDNLTECMKYPNFIIDGSIKNDMMFIGGAYSIDKQYRTEGINYWSDEELSYFELLTAYDIYSQHKPKIMITHCCPKSIIGQMFNAKSLVDSRTESTFDIMFEEHQPKLWLFGHWHEDVDKVINGTRFICIKTLNYVDIDLNLV